MTAPNTPLHHNVDQESIADTQERQMQFEGLMPTLRVLHSTWAESGESAQHTFGERSDGVGSENCDQETRAWNPRFMSMNYALARVAKTGQ